MNASSRIIINTFAQYIRTVINILLSLYSARLVLEILGVEDYGLYALIAGVVSMLSFFTNSLVSSTQRFLSISQGRGDLERLREVFGNSLLLHIFLGLLVAILLEALTPFLFHGFLNIPVGREDAAIIIYQQVILMVYISFIAAPYRALLVSRENIVYISIIDVLDGVLKVVFVLLLPFIPLDKLIAYGWVMLLISLFNLGAFSIYSHAHYTECILPRFRYFRLSYVKELSAYTGWVVYSTLCIALRTQGLAVVLNRGLGTAINAAYGIGSQISGMVSFISASFNNAIAPQLMAAEGGGNREHMWLLAKVESKFSFLLLAMVGIPTMFEMRSLLEIWLVEVPPATMLFGCMFLSMQIIDMLTTGLGLANRAIGKISLYTIVTYTPKLLILPLGWFALNVGMPLWVIAVMMIGVEGLCMLLRIPLLLRERGFRAGEYCRDVLLRTLPPVVMGVAACSAICVGLDFPFRFLLTYLVSIPLFAGAAYRWSLTEAERGKVEAIVCHFLERQHRKIIF